MKKMMRLAYFYAFVALAAGVFYREFTKWNGFTGRTSLSVMHPHLFIFGTVLMLIFILFMKSFNIKESNNLNRILTFYNLGLGWTVLMMLVRGIVQALQLDLSSGLNAAISGIAGLGHIILGVSLILLLNYLRKGLNQHLSQRD